MEPGAADDLESLFRAIPTGLPPFPVRFALQYLHKAEPGAFFEFLERTTAAQFYAWRTEVNALRVACVLCPCLRPQHAHALVAHAELVVECHLRVRDEARATHPSHPCDAKMPFTTCSALTALKTFSDSHATLVHFDQECPVCLEATPRALVSLCGHHLCGGCYRRMRPKRNRPAACPICRRPFLIIPSAVAEKKNGPLLSTHEGKIERAR